MSQATRVALVATPETAETFRLLNTRLAEASPAIRLFRTFNDFRDSLAEIRDTEVIVSASAHPMDSAVFVELSLLRALISPFIGYEGFDLSAAARHNIIVANGHTDENIESMAESTIMLILDGLYGLEHTRRAMREGWRTSRHARMLRGRRVGLVGFGRIAEAVANRLQAWKVELLISTRRPAAALPRHARVAPLDELLTECDVVSVHAALSAETRNLLDERRLRLMPDDGLLVVTSRGGVVDEDALATIAMERPGFRAALDVFRVEPLPLESPLRGLPNIALTPHMVGHTLESREALLRLVVENVSRALTGREILHRCDVTL